MKGRAAQRRLARETFSTPRRLTARFAHPGVGAADGHRGGRDRPAGRRRLRRRGTDARSRRRFARKQGVEVSTLERLDVPEKKGVYLAVRKHQRGKAAVDVLPDVLTATLRGLSFPKQMRWDARLDDGRGELPFGRPIRWIVFLYGGRVVPFTIARTPTPRRAGAGRPVRAVTYGHRFLATTGRPGRADQGEGVRRLPQASGRALRGAGARRTPQPHCAGAGRRSPAAGRAKVATALVGRALLQEVPDLVEVTIRAVGHFPEVLQLPEEVLTTTMIHHQHFFPVVSDQGRLLPVFLAVLNTEPDRPEVVSRNLERVLTARLRDARFFWDADRAQPLSAFVDRLDTVLFHKKLGSYREKADRVGALAGWICGEVLGRPDLADAAGEAGRLCKADLATDMVRELTELQGTIGGIYAREDGRPETVWKAVYHHYLPQGVEADAPPTRAQLGEAAVTWAAVSMADKLDTLVGMFAAGERPTGSRDPFGLRRAAQGLVRTLMDLPELTGVDAGVRLGPLVDRAASAFDVFTPDARAALDAFLLDRVRYVLEQRRSDVRNVRAVTHGRVEELAPLYLRRLLAALPEFTETPDFRTLAMVFKRVRNIARTMPDEEFDRLAADAPGMTAALTEPAERALAAEVAARHQAIHTAASTGQAYRDALAEAAKYGPTVATFFDDVLVMAEDPSVRQARLFLMKALERQILQLADVSEIVPQES
ncbi:MAG: glycine--tRNA ligase subunit beta [Vicinamibacterales bacterium]